MRLTLRISTICILLITATAAFSQPGAKKPTPKKPKLVVGIVIDQMRWDYLYRFNELYSTGGFKRMMGQGFSCDNTLVPYMPTYTAPGHTCVYTGSVPAIHGIVGNNWYEKASHRNVYCTDDSTVNTVGSSSTLGKMSPKNMWTTTIGDELRLSNNFKSKVIGVSLKDRGAILPAGHSANAAYWYDETVGKWITSTHYMNALPTWVDAINAKDMPATYMSQDWNTMLPIGKYDLSTPDDEPWEGKIPGEKTSTFPHKLSSIASGRYSSFKYTPYAMEYTFDFAKEAINNEKLGAGEVTDFLAVSISSSDYIGHTFGPNSIEIEDAYLHLDKYIASFLTYLDANLGKDNYMVFLTADHAVAHVPGFLKEHKLPGGTFSDDAYIGTINNAVEAKFGIKKAVLSIQNYQVYLDDSAVINGGKSMDEVKALAITILKQNPIVVNAVSTTAINTTALPEPQKRMFENGFNPQRCGDILFTFKPGYFEGGSTGTTHGLWNPYDAHIPLLFYGWNIKQGKTNRETYMTDIAATVTAMLNVQMPSGCVGKVITEVMK